MAENVSGELMNANMCVSIDTVPLYSGLKFLILMER